MLKMKAVLLFLVICASLVICTEMALAPMEVMEVNEPIKEKDVVDFSSDLPIFEPTCQYKEILEGQHIPGGLDISVNLETGVKLARKICSEEETQKEIEKEAENAAIVTKAKLSILKELPEPEKEILTIDENTMTTEEIDALVDEVWQRRQKVIRDVMDNLQTDAKIISQRLLELSEVEKYDEEYIIAALDELEYLCEDIDNAKDFVKMGGISIVGSIFNNNTQKVDELIAYLMGTVVRHNYAAQKEASNFLFKLLASLAGVLNGGEVGDEIGLVNKLLFSIDSIISNNQETHKQLFDTIDVGQVLARVLEKYSSDFSIIGKAFSLFNDLHWIESNRTKALKSDERVCRALAFACPSFSIDNASPPFEKWISVVQMMDLNKQNCVKYYQEKELVESLSQWKLRLENEISSEGKDSYAADLIEPFEALVSLITV
eukprot:TRINITY_DN2835_c0_g1_i1.p1 TRINITY_DN2835_c0_g1~~TRINITY_DN2835_c0_g1_i1.p1  ORF type:complete len:433 (-),score=121.39 TRINITY_DN2835_c0_g1_i1:162-1460(-)